MVFGIVCFFTCSYCVFSAKVISPGGLYGFGDIDSFAGPKLESFFKITPSLKSWNIVDTSQRFNIISMSVDHSSQSSWFMPSLHEKYSAGWNRSVHSSQFSNMPIACNIRFFGVGLESTLEGFQTGGTGYLTLGYTNANKRELWHGFDKNESNKLHCYYKTNKDTGSEFIVRVLLLF
jgi:hypothetical protein